MTAPWRRTFPELVGGPRAGEELTTGTGDLKALELPHPAGDREDTTDTVTYLLESLVLGGAAVDVWLYRAPARGRQGSATFDDALEAIARRACK